MITSSIIGYQLSCNCIYLCLLSSRCNLNGLLGKCGSARAPIGCSIRTSLWRTWVCEVIICSEVSVGNCWNFRIHGALSWDVSVGSTGEILKACWGSLDKHRAMDVKKESNFPLTLDIIKTMVSMFVEVRNEI